MKCKICGKEFKQKSFPNCNQLYCSEECKKEATKQVKKKYRKSEKGYASLKRWYKNPNKKKIDLKYRKSIKGLETSAKRNMRLLVSDPHVLFRKRLGQTALYRRLRHQLILKYKKCRICGSRNDLTIDHIVPMRIGGKHEIKNIQLLCRSCNAKKGSIERKEYAMPSL
jgi:5-methylcytosine-specific restriction endonuclease McrA